MLEYTHSHVVRTKKSPAKNKKMGEEDSSKAEQNMNRKGKGCFRQANKGDNKIKAKRGEKQKKGTSKSKESIKFRRLPQQITSSPAITG